MAIARSAIVFTGTDETTGVTIANNATNTGSEVDILGDALSVGILHLYLKYTSTLAAGSIIVTFVPRRITAQPYLDQPPAAHQFTLTPINGTEQIYLGSIITTRLGSINVKNSAIGASITNVFVAGELLKLT